jgi:SP family sugar:H+ symporter-like MFS transporter
MFEAKLPARRFRKYVCVGRHVPVSDEKIVRRGSSGSEKDEVVRQEVVGLEKTG